MNTLQSDFVSAVSTILKPQRIARGYSELRCTFGSRSVVPDVTVAFVLTVGQLFSWLEE
jgi:hypothetical protein